MSENSKPDLKPCPFCGSKDILLHDVPTIHGIYWAECPNCNTEGPTTGDPEAAAVLWNKRLKTPLHNLMHRFRFRKVGQWPGNHFWGPLFERAYNGEEITDEKYEEAISTPEKHT